MRFHWQNLSSEVGRTRHGFWHGRAWLNGFESLPHTGLRVEWSHGKLGLGVELNFERDEREVQLHVAGPGFSWWLALEGAPSALLGLLPFSYRRTEYNYQGSDRSIGFRVFGKAIWFSLWDDRMESRSSDPWWMRGRFGLDDIADFFFGKTQYSSRPISTHEVKIAMPEKSYDAIVTIDASSWIRPRWPWRPFSMFRVGSDVKIEGGIPIPGKGENSWDIGDDAVYGFTSPAKTVEAAIGNVVSSVLRTRMKRIGRHTMEK
jgi:hypothetical protein